MKNKNDNADDMRSARIFTYGQLAKISEANYEVLGFEMYPLELDDSHKFLGIPIMKREVSIEGSIKVIMSISLISLWDRFYFCTQHMTIGQFEQGEPLC